MGKIVIWSSFPWMKCNRCLLSFLHLDTLKHVYVCKLSVWYFQSVPLQWSRLSRLLTGTQSPEHTTWALMPGFRDESPKLQELVRHACTCKVSLSIVITTGNHTYIPLVSIIGGPEEDRCLEALVNGATGWMCFFSPVNNRLDNLSRASEHRSCISANMSSWDCPLFR